MTWQASPETDDDLIAGRNFIAADNELAARAFLDAAFDAFEDLARFPGMGPKASIKNRRLRGLRFFILPPPFNGWLIFYVPTKGGVDILRVLYGSVNWRDEPERFF